MEQIFFYNMVSYVTVCVVLILIYVFITLYLKTIYRHLNSRIIEVERKVDEIKASISKKG